MKAAVNNHKERGDAKGEDLGGTVDGRKGKSMGGKKRQRMKREKIKNGRVRKKKRGKL